MDKRITAQLVERAKKGDDRAIERLYDLHCRRVYALCLRMTSNQAEAEDLTQETFLQAFRKLNTFRGDAAFATWIYRIATNVVLMKRRKKVLPEVSLDDTTTPGGVTARVIRSVSRPDPTLKLVDRLSLSWALGQLPEGYKRVFVMHDVQGYAHNEIAEMTGCSTGNSKSQLFKARQRLRELLTSDSRALHA